MRRHLYISASIEFMCSSRSFLYLLDKITCRHLYLCVDFFHENLQDHTSYSTWRPTSNILKKSENKALNFTLEGSLPNLLLW